MQHLLLFGATGLVGQQVLQLALADSSIDRITAPTRRPLTLHPKLANPIIDFDSLSNSAPWWSADGAISALGTTIRQAGSQAQFRRVDHDYVLAVAQSALTAGTKVFAVISSIGANPHSPQFYLRVKGETERDLAALGFASLTVVRPSLLDGGPRRDKRPGEGFALAISHLLAPVIPRRYRAISTTKVARALLSSAASATPGTHIIESEHIHNV